MRRGVTLFELMLVLALLVLIGALSWPAIENSFATSRLRAAGDEVRSALGEARLAAMRSGVIHAFRYQTEAGAYKIERWNEEGQLQVADAGATPLAAGDGDLTRTRSLSEEITFAEGKQANNRRAAAAAQNAGVSLEEDTVWSPPLMFYPDGTTTDAALLIKSERGRYVQVVLRGLTGIARVSATLTYEELEE